jgi:NADPH2:quinone reductase
VYGASSALGTYSIKLAKLAGVHPIIAIAGSSSAYVTSFLDPSKGDAILDYRVGPEKLKAAVKEALKGVPAHHAIDSISEKGTWVPISQMLDPTQGVLSVFSGPYKFDEEEIPAGVKIIYTFVGTAHLGAYMPGAPKQPEDKEFVKGDIEFAARFYSYLTEALAQGKFEGHPYEIIPGGLEGVAEGLQKLKAGQSKGKKFVFQIEH